MNPSGAPPKLIWTLESIAAALQVDERTLRRWLRRPPGERPPVRRCHRGFYAHESRLQDWVDAEDMDAGVYMRLGRDKRPPGEAVRAGSVRSSRKTSRNAGE